MFVLLVCGVCASVVCVIVNVRVIICRRMLFVCACVVCVFVYVRVLFVPECCFCVVCVLVYVWVILGDSRCSVIRISVRMFLRVVVLLYVTRRVIILV